MPESRRWIAVLIMLLSQVAGGMAVICDQGIGAQVLELSPETCCGTPDDPAPASHDQDADGNPCEACFDVPLVSFHLTDDDRPGSGPPEAVVVTTAPHAPLAQPAGRALLPRGGAPPGASPTAARLLGTVVQLR